MTIDTDPNKLLWIEPKCRAAVTPIIDQLTRRMAGALRSASPHDHTRGWHECTGCGSGRSSCSYYLPGGLVTHGLCVHYLAYHRDEVPADQLAMVGALWCPEMDPLAHELAGDAGPGGSGTTWRDQLTGRIRQTFATAPPPRPLEASDPVTTDWIAACVSLDRSRQAYSPLVALADLIVEWLAVTRSLHAEERRLPAFSAVARLGELLERQDAIEVVLAHAVKERK